MKRPLEFVAIAGLLEHVSALMEEGFDEIEDWFESERHKRRHRFVPVAGRFAGFYTTTPIGDIIMATQQLTVGTAETCPLIFTDASGATGPGPIGTVTSSDPSVTVSLSADGQSCNATMTAPNITATLTWNGTNQDGTAFSFSVDVTDSVVAPFVPVAGSFGTFAPGTTA